MSDSTEFLVAQEPLSQEDIELFGHYKFLIPITVNRRSFHVPENLSVLRALQYLEVRKEVLTMKWGRFCWNNTVGCCELRYQNSRDEPCCTGRGCQLMVSPGMQITKLPKGGRLVGGTDE